MWCNIKKMDGGDIPLHYSLRDEQSDWYQLSKEDIGSGFCRLKDSGENPCTATLIDYGGVITFGGDGVTETMGCVCPAVWVDSDKFESLQQTGGQLFS